MHINIGPCVCIAKTACYIAMSPVSSVAISTCLPTVACYAYIPTLQKLKYDIHTKLPLESYQNNEFGMIPVTIWYEYHASVFAVYTHIIAIYI